MKNKNIFVLSTDKPSRLLVRNDKPFVLMLKEHSPFSTNETHTSQNIYITSSDEEIKEGDYRMNIQRSYFKKSDKEGLEYYNKRNDVFKKIILTTDQDLIKDGVQAIDDEFLQWFVKNPSCEWVEVVELWKEGNPSTFDSYQIIIPKEEEIVSEYDVEPNIMYGENVGERIKIKAKIISKEEPKQETQGYICPQTKKQCDDECCVSAEDCHIKASFGIISDCESSEQETVEEAAERIYQEDFNTPYLEEVRRKNIKDAMIKLAKWQQEQDKNKYSEEDMKLAFEAGYRKGFSGYPNTENWKELPFEKWFEQFKRNNHE